MSDHIKTYFINFDLLKTSLTNSYVKWIGMFDKLSK